MLKILLLMDVLLGQSLTISKQKSAEQALQDMIAMAEPLNEPDKVLESRYQTERYQELSKSDKKNLRKILTQTLPSKEKAGFILGLEVADLNEKDFEKTIDDLGGEYKSLWESSKKQYALENMSTSDQQKAFITHLPYPEIMTQKELDRFLKTAPCEPQNSIVSDPLLTLHKKIRNAKKRSISETISTKNSFFFSALFEKYARDNKIKTDEYTGHKYPFKDLVYHNRKNFYLFGNDKNLIGVETAALSEFNFDSTDHLDLQKWDYKEIKNGSCLCVVLKQ